MASNSFGTLFRITTWGESHGKAIGVVIDGCPPDILFDEKVLHQELAKRAPGNSPYTSPRKEPDQAEIYSGVFEGKTTGAPISIIIPNRGADSAPYELMKEVIRPGHANATYLKKYGCFDYRGGGRASARETAARVAAGAVAKQLLSSAGIQTEALLVQVGNETDHEAMMKAILLAKEQGDSVGGAVQFMAQNVPAGLGDPIYEKMEAKLASAMLSIPASKAFEIGSGADCITMTGSAHNQGDHSGGILGGITTGDPLVGKVFFKPTSSIAKPQETLTLTGEKTTLILPKGAKHDPCVAVRAVAVVEAMLAVVLADALLMQRRYR